MDTQTESVSEAVVENPPEVAEALPPPPPAIKMKKVFDRTTGQYTLVPKKESVKFIKQMPPSMRHFAKKMNARKFLTPDEVRAFVNRVVNRRRKKVAAQKMKWSNYQLAKENR